MKRRRHPLIVLTLLLTAVAGSSSALAQGNSARPDPRLKEITYDPAAVVTVPVQRGVVTHVMLDEGEAITDVGSGLGADCNKPEATWCIAAQAGSHHLFVKPKSTATVPNNLAVVTTRRTHAFRFVVLPPGDSRVPVFRLVVKPPLVRAAATADPGSAPPTAAASVELANLLAATQHSPEEVVSQRLAAAPTPMNWQYSLAEGAQSQDIVPTLVFDDGRFTYLRFPNSREVPAVFHVLGDGTETLVNARMEGDLLVVDRVSRRLMLRAGQAVVGVWNDAFDLDGVPPEGGTTVDGVRRLLRTTQPQGKREQAMTTHANPHSRSEGDRPQGGGQGDLPPDRAEPEGLAPLEGEAGIPSVTQLRGVRVSWVRLGAFCGALVLATVLAVVLLQRYIPSGKTSAQAQTARAADRPTAAAAEPRRLDLTPSTPPKAPAPPSPLIPALVPTEAELQADPIGLRRSGAPNGGANRAPLRPEDSPVLLVSGRPGASNRHTSAAEPADDADTPAPTSPLQETQRNLQAYQRQLDSLLNNLTRATGAVSSRSATTAAPSAGSNLPPSVSAAMSALNGSGNSATTLDPGSHSGGALFGGQLQGSATPRVSAGLLGNRSLTLPKGTAFTCALKTKVVSAASGFVGCQVQRNVYSDDGRVLLIERGSHLDGEYRITSVKPGMVRIPVLWTRIRTPLGVTVNVESPGTGPLGESGIDGHVDNRWGERIGAAMLLSLIDDAVQLVVQRQSTDADATTLVLPSTTDNTSKLAEKVLDSTINIPPLIYQNQGGIVGIYVARDVDFSSVYELQPTTLALPRGEAP